MNILLSIWEKKGLEDAVFAFQDCILNGTSLRSVVDTKPPKPKTKKSKKVKSSNDFVFDDVPFDIMPIDDPTDYIDVLDVYDEFDLGNLLID